LEDISRAIEQSATMRYIDEGGERHPLRLSPEDAMTFREPDIGVLTAALPEAGLRPGDIGTVTHQYDGTTVEVEALSRLVVTSVTPAGNLQKNVLLAPPNRHTSSPDTSSGTTALFLNQQYKRATQKPAWRAPFPPRSCRCSPPWPSVFLRDLRGEKGQRATRR